MAQPAGRKPPLKPRKSVPPARAAALNALRVCFEDGRDLQAALHPALESLTDPRDVALATELAYGVARLSIRLDALLDHFLSKPGKLPPAARRMLRVAAYELTQLDRVPAYATLGWAVDAVRSRFGPGLGKVATAVLRNIERLGNDANTPELYATADEAAALARWYACPPWLVELWLAEHGPEGGRALLEAQLNPPPLGLRINGTKPGARELFDGLARDALLADFPTLALVPGGRVEPGLLTEGRVSRQSAAAQLTLRRLEPQVWPTPVWDACAGRGGKTLALLEMGVAPVWASDPSRERLAQLLPEARRLGLDEPPAFLARAEHPPLGQRPQTILLDAPCSGLGVISRRPDTKLKRTPKDLKTLAKLQGRILESAADMLPSGGRLVYITCTTARSENEAQIGKLLQKHPTLRLLAEHPIEPHSPLGEFFYGAVLGS